MKQQVVLLGQVGSGKTTLLNKICNTDETTRYGGHSVTQNIFSRSAAYGQGFTILDTPGFGSDRDRLAHAATIVAALQDGPINRILVVVKYDRICLMKEAMMPILLPIRQHKDLVTIIVTNWDKSQNPRQDEQDLKKDLCGFFNIHSYILSGNNVGGYQLCQQIENNLSNSIFQSSFEILESNVKDWSMLADIDDYSKDFKKCVQTIKAFIITFNKDHPDLDEIMHALTVWIKQLAQNTITEFEQKNAKKMDQIFGQTGDALQSYLYQMELKKSIQGTLSEVIMQAQDKMRLKLDHPFNYIKQCPHCNIIWVKEEGCDGMTTCGKRTLKNQLFGKVQQSIRYIFSYDKKSNELNVSQQQNLQRPKTGLSQIQIESTWQGCGAEMVWKDLPPLSRAQLEQLIDPGILDFLSESRGFNFYNVQIQKIYQSQVNIAIAQARLNKK